MSGGGREGVGGTIVVVAALVIFLAVLAWGLLPYLTSALERIEQVAP